MKKILILSILFFSLIAKGQNQQLLSPAGEIVTVSKPALPAGFYWVNDSLIGLADSGIEIKKINIKFGTSLTLVNGVLNVVPGTLSITDYKIAIATKTGNNLSFTFPNVPADYSSYMIYRGRLPLEPITEYTTTGNVVTILVKCYAGDHIRYQL